MESLAQIPKARQAVAQYVRMSTEHQQYSTENQSLAILKYAQSRNMDIVRTYSDHGKSGLSLSGRAGLRQLLADVQSGDVDFTAVLVYDVSRWGRFQNPDQGDSLRIFFNCCGYLRSLLCGAVSERRKLSSALLKTVKARHGRGIQQGTFCQSLGRATSIDRAGISPGRPSRIWAVQTPYRSK